MKLIFTSILICLFWKQIFANAILSTGNFFPVGHKEKFLGNTGTALSGQLGNALYNPGGHCFIEDTRNTSVSGLTIISINEDGQNQNDSLYSKLAYTAVRYTLKGYSIMFYGYSPFSHKPEENIEIDTINIEIDGLYLGTSISKKISNSFGIGFTAQFAKEVIKLNGNISADMNSDLKFINIIKMKQELSFIQFQLGLLKKIGSKFQFGLKLSPPFITTKSEAQIKSKSLFNGMILEVSEKKKPKFHSLWDATIGINYKVNSKWSLLVEIGHMFAHSKTNTFFNAEDEKIKGQWRVSTGSQIKLNSKYTALLGVSYKYRSQKRGLEEISLISKMFSVGLSYKRKKRHEFIIGGFMMDGDGTQTIGFNMSSLYSI